MSYLGLGTPCEVVRPNSHAFNNGDCMDWPHVTWDLGLGTPLNHLRDNLFTLRIMRATSHMSQEPWPCNGEDFWLSSKGRTTRVGKAVLCRHGPSSIVWSENGPCYMTIAYFVGGKKGEAFVLYNTPQTLSLWEKYLVMFVLSWNMPCTL